MAYRYICIYLNGQPQKHLAAMPTNFRSLKMRSAEWKQKQQQQQKQRKAKAATDCRHLYLADTHNMRSFISHKRQLMSRSGGSCGFSMCGAWAVEQTSAASWLH